MKRTLLVVLSLVITVVNYAQGIEFEHGTWAEVLEKAKQTNKPIFIDVFTTWCGPCKMMSSEVFPLAAVGSAYNKNFVCYKIDAEKGEGVNIAKEYEVNAYPTYLFIKADKSLIMKGVGRMDADKFISLSETVNDELTSSKPISTWDKEYAKKRKDTAFLFAYIQKRTKLGIKNTELFDEYLTLLPNSKRSSTEVIELYKKESRNLKVNSVAYKNLQVNAFAILPKLGYLSNSMMASAIYNSFTEAKSTKNEQLLQQVIEANTNLPASPETKQNEELYMEYYKSTNNIDKYVIHATKYCETSLMNISPDSIAKLDEVSAQTFEKSKSLYLSAIKDSAQIAELKEYMAHSNRNKYGEALNNVAWGFFEKVTDKKALENALAWSKRSLEINTKHYSLDTYANLLYKLGRKEEAIAKETEALENAKSSKAKTKNYEDVLKKINAGEKTWK